MIAKNLLENKTCDNCRFKSTYLISDHSFPIIQKDVDLCSINSASSDTLPFSSEARNKKTKELPPAGTCDYWQDINILPYQSYSKLYW